MINEGSNQAVFFEVVLKKDFSKDSWDMESLQTYHYTVRVFNRFGNGRTYKQFLLDMLGRKR